MGAINSQRIYSAHFFIFFLWYQHGLFHHFLYGTLKLGVVTIEEVFRRVIDFDVRIESGVLAPFAAHISTAYLRNAEYETVIDEVLPPYCCHGACHWRADELAYLEVGIYLRETVTVAVVILTHQDA